MVISETMFSVYLARKLARRQDAHADANQLHFCY
jgi:hypothetical protein